ncbi:oxalate:formate antiporter, partial [Clonorchis sinensis]
NMAPYIVDYMNSNNISVDKTSAVWLTSVGFSMQSIAMPLSAYTATKIGFRIVVICSCVLHSGSIALTYFAVGWGYWAVVLFYGIFTGIGFGAGYSVIIATASEWFPNRRGLVVGLVLGGFGAGALIFTPVQTGFINPANLKINTTTGSFTQPEILNRVPQAFLLLAGITATLQIIGLFLMQEKPQVSLFSFGNETRKMVDVPPLTVFKALDFYLLWLSVCCGAIPITLVTSLYKVAGSRYIYDDIFLAGTSMAASVCNSVGRVIWGRVCDRISFKKIRLKVVMRRCGKLQLRLHLKGAYVRYVHLMDGAAAQFSIHLRIHRYCRKGHVRPVG